MVDQFCVCYHKAFVEVPVYTWSTSLEFVALILVAVIGIFLNYKFLAKLEKERKATPIGRKGNVIDPIMRWFLVFQMVYWPYLLLYRWLTTNELLPIKMLPTWLCYALPYAKSLGRMFIAYNSFFVALVRYIYIIHHVKANQWSFEVIGNLFRTLSVIFPITIFAICVLTDELDLIKPMPSFKECIIHHNVTYDDESLNPIPVKWTLQYLPSSFVMAVEIIFQSINMFFFLNFPEAFMYFRMFSHIKRYDDNLQF